MQERRTDSTDDITPEESFEDVGLNDEPKPVKKRGIFARFGDSNNTDTVQEEKPASSHHFSFTGRKRAQSGGQGSELKSMSDITSPDSATEAPIDKR